ncbi:MULTISPECIES: YchJ family protein [unclassified Salinibacterium]|uniref:YchJ family protein n=1 Tax=unclassified Salinibacterium TaxID=2632331 RepID=UPI0018CE9290|nr:MULTISPECIES: YchJ family protein [unclassified Salinibacterium]MBH0054294.1 YchJ family protein [Salinibacterium sp. SWN139]MBH0083580.1 YchJ family protein [Salinibacterium sp. SWN167]
MKACPCQSLETYDDCCGRFHRGEALAPTAERLMRSRYSAYVRGETDYLLQTWHPSTRPATLELDADVRWFRLEIVARTGGSMFDSQGTVEFRAHYRNDGSADQQHENSSFVRENGAWLYVDAV